VVQHAGFGMAILNMPTAGELLGGFEAVRGPVDSNWDLARAIRDGPPAAVALQLAREILEIATESVESRQASRLTGGAIIVFRRPAHLET